MKKQKKQKKQEEEKSCKHQWASLLAKYKGTIVPVSSAKICLKCGVLKVGTQTIKMSRFRLAVINPTCLKVPVGTNLYY
jgi:hypothetical protein